jgi:hypothetical protein
LLAARANSCPTVLNSFWIIVYSPLIYGDDLIMVFRLMGLIIHDRSLCEANKFLLETRIKRILKEESDRSSEALIEENAKHLCVQLAGGQIPLLPTQPDSTIRSCYTHSSMAILVAYVCQYDELHARAEFVSKLRKLLPVEILISWTIMKEGFNRASPSSDCPSLFSQSHMVAVTIVWSTLLVVRSHVFDSGRDQVGSPVYRKPAVIYPLLPAKPLELCILSLLHCV